MAFSTIRVNMANMLPTKFPSLLRPYPSMRESWWSSCLFQHRVVICCHDSGDGHPLWPRIDIYIDYIGSHTRRINSCYRRAERVGCFPSDSWHNIPCWPWCTTNPRLPCCCDLSAIVFKGRIEISIMLPQWARCDLSGAIAGRFGLDVQRCAVWMKWWTPAANYETLGGSRSHSVSIFSNGGF